MYTRRVNPVCSLLISEFSPTILCSKMSVNYSIKNNIPEPLAWGETKNGVFLLEIELLVCKKCVIVRLMSFLTVSQEERVRKLLCKPFKIPIPGYQLSGRSLGSRLSGPRRPLYDPDEANALVVFTPPEMSEHDKLKADQSVLYKFCLLLQAI